MNKLLWLSWLFLTSLPASGQPSITAETWLNGLTMRPGDDRAALVLFFDESSLQGRNRELTEQVNHLSRLARRGDLLVMAVTPATEHVGQAFIERFKPRFPVGVRSTAHRAHRVSKFPIVLHFKGDRREEITDLAVWHFSLPPEPERTTAAPGEMPLPELQEYIEETGQLRWLELARIRMDAESFMDYCDKLEARLKQDGPAWLGPLRYQRHLADPNAAEKQPPSTPALETVREAIRTGRPQRAEYHELLAARQDWTYEEIMDVFARNLSDDDESLVHRSAWVWALGRTENPDFVGPLLDMLDREPDAGIRNRIANAIGGIHTSNPLPDRREVATRLEQFLAFEDNIAWGRPGIELTIDLLKSYPGPLDEVE